MPVSPGVVAAPAPPLGAHQQQQRCRCHAPWAAQGKDTHTPVGACQTVYCCAVCIQLCWLHCTAAYSTALGLLWTGVCSCGLHWAHLYTSPVHSGGPPKPAVEALRATTSCGLNLCAGSWGGGDVPQPLLGTRVSRVRPNSPPSASDTRRLSRVRPRACCANHAVGWHHRTPKDRHQCSVLL